VFCTPEQAETLQRQRTADSGWVVDGPCSRRPPSRSMVPRSPSLTGGRTTMESPSSPAHRLGPQRHAADVTAHPSHCFDSHLSPDSQPASALLRSLRISSDGRGRQTPMLIPSCTSQLWTRTPVCKKIPFTRRAVSWRKAYPILHNAFIDQKTTATRERERILAPSKSLK